ncbi:MAG: hypothetical protein HW391_924 [Chloroflexi bacterium]|nr:hypothetical protein [Chloroflexota bacterium]
MALPAGSNVRLEGVIDERYGARTLRVAATAVMDLGPGAIPPAAAAETGVIGADLEGRRVVVVGLTSGSPTTFADGLGILVDDGTGPIRAIVGAEALAGAEIPAGTLVRVSGPVGQRDSSGTGTGGYRIHATEPGELEILPPPPTPTPPPTPEPTPDPTPTPTPEPSPAPSATSSPTPSISPTVAIAEARARAVGSIVTVIGVVTAEAGRIGTPPLFAIADATAGVLIRLPEGSSPPVRGGLIQVTGPLAAPFGQLEIRPGAGGMAHLGVDSPPAVLSILAADIGEGTEARLVTMTGRVTAPPRKSPSGDLAIEVTDVAGRTFRVMTDASSGLAATDLRLGQTYSLVGLVGQRASKKDALDGYRIWLRDRGDVTSIPEGPGGASPAPSAEGGSPAVMTLAEAAALTDAAATVEGVVTAGAGLLDAEGRRIVIQDATGGIEVLLGAGLAPPSAGARVRVEGIVGRAWGAPRLRASTVQILGTGPDVAPRILSGTPGESLEWQVVRIAGAISRVTRLGDRWRADVRVGGETILVTGLTGAGIASTSLVEGRAVTIVGIVRRPYPTATDRRWAILPRGPWDVAIGPAGSAAATASGAGNHIGAGGAGNESSGGAGAPGSHPAIRDVDIATLADHVGELVRVGGLVVAQTSDGFSLDDGTAIGAIVLRGDAAAFLDLIGAGEAIGIVGRVERRKDGLPAVIATDPAGLVRLGSLGETVPIAAGASASGAPSPTSRAVAVAGLGGPLDGPIGGWLGMSGLLVASAVSLFVAALRRRRVHLRLARVVAGRLAELKRSSGSA